MLHKIVRNDVITCSLQSAELAALKQCASSKENHRTHRTTFTLSGGDKQAKRVAVRGRTDKGVVVENERQSAGKMINRWTGNNAEACHANNRTVGLRDQPSGGAFLSHLFGERLLDPIPRAGCERPQIAIVRGTLARVLQKKRPNRSLIIERRGSYEYGHSAVTIAVLKLRSSFPDSIA